MQLLPAGVPRSFRHLRYRVSAIFEGAPLLFLGVVLGIALVFRVGIGLLRPLPTNEPNGITAAAALAGPTTPRAAPPAPTADGELHPKGHIVDPPPVASGRLRPEVAAPRKKRAHGALERPF